MSDLVIGLRVRATLDEEGDIGPSTLPLGTIVRKFVGTDGTTYHEVRPDDPFRFTDMVEEELILVDLTIAPVFKGDRLDQLLDAPLNHWIPVGVAKLLTPISPVVPFWTLLK
jgi:hypothetical protein